MFLFRMQKSDRQVHSCSYSYWFQKKEIYQYLLSKCIIPKLLDGLCSNKNEFCFIFWVWAVSYSTEISMLGGFEQYYLAPAHVVILGYLCLRKGHFFMETNAVMKIKQPIHQGCRLLLLSVVRLPLDYFDITFTAFITVLTLSKCFCSLTFIWDACITSIVTYRAMLLPRILHRFVYL